MIKLNIHHYKVHFINPFAISRERRTKNDVLIVELSHKGMKGFGECCPNKYYGHTCESLEHAIKKAESFLEFINPAIPPDSYWPELLECLEGNYFALNALDTALWDLWARNQEKPLYKCWNLNIKNNVASNFTIGIDTIETMVKKIKSNSGWPFYKIKLGTADDVGIIKALRKDTDAVFRIDANCAWSVDETILNSEELKSLGVEFIEQPLSPDNRNGMREVFKHSALPVIADESCIVEEDVSRCANIFHGINIKMMKCGGFTPARRMIENARVNNLKVMMGCMSETSIGISAIAQLLPCLDFVDMDSANLMTDNPATGVVVKKGICHYLDAPGCGGKLNNQYSTRNIQLSSE